MVRAGLVRHENRAARVVPPEAGHLDTDENFEEGTDEFGDDSDDDQ